MEVAFFMVSGCWRFKLWLVGGIPRWSCVLLILFSLCLCLCVYCCFRMFDVLLDVVDHGDVSRGAVHFVVFVAGVLTSLHVRVGVVREALTDHDDYDAMIYSSSSL